MNYESNDPSQPGEPEQPEAQSCESESKQNEKYCSSDSFDEFVRSTRDAIRTGIDDARETVQNNYPKVKEDFAKGVRDVAYAVAYAGAFGVTLLKELTPDTIRNGAREGSDAGSKAATEFVQKQRDTSTSEEPVDEGDSSPQMA